MADQYTLRLPAIRIRQGRQHIYSFGVDGKRIHEFATVSRVRRDGDNQLLGYQRPEVLSHIRAIRRYLESDNPMLPNAIVVAFDDRVTFEAAGLDTGVDYATLGELIIPIDEALDDNQKPGWLVDGQQRAAAIRDADVADFPVAAVAFIATTEDQQRSHFILVNNTKPLPKGLIHELLPETPGHLPVHYARRKLPASIMMRLNSEPGGTQYPDSPFYRRIATPTTPGGVIKDNSVLNMIENSLYEGALYQYRNPLDGTADEDAILLHLRAYWALVAATFPDAWALEPRKSRLTHGVGIRAMGYLMDHLTDGVTAEKIPELPLGKRLAGLRPVTAWTEGMWHFSAEEHRRWNGLQNTQADIRLLTNFLLRAVV